MKTREEIEETLKRFNPILRETLTIASKYPSLSLISTSYSKKESKNLFFSGEPFLKLFRYTLRRFNREANNENLKEKDTDCYNYLSCFLPERLSQCSNH